MATPASAFAHHSHPLRSSQASFFLATPATNSFDQDAIRSAPAPFSTADPVSVLFRHLPPTVTLEQVKMMVMWSEEVANIEIFPDTGDKTCSALVKFNSHNDALQAKHILDGKQNMDVEILGMASPSASRGYGIEPPATSASSAGSSATSSGPSSRQPSRFNGAFPPVDKISPPMGAAYSANELPNPEESARYQTLFSPQSPIGVHLSDRGPRISGKSLIKNDTTDDDETGELLKDPVAYAENGTMPSQRRATAPHLPISQLASLSLGNSSPAGGPSSLPPYGPHGIMQGHPTASPTAMNGGGNPGMPYSMGGHFSRHSNFPPVNPADQNPPCNTLYVGNLPIDTSEEELKAMFSKQRGYKRLCFRTKQNGPMCFVEFEDVTFATKALNELYGQMLHNSVKGGIRLSFSKNPLGVRSGQTGGQVASGAMTGMMAGSPNGFTTASGPPPGLSAPPGLGAGRYGGSHGNQSYTLAGFPGSGSMSSNPWNSYKGTLASGGPNSMMSSNGSSNYMAPHMLGK